jgi:D-alanine-D-alanine ligase-like ATP-grasp enzyme
MKSDKPPQGQRAVQQKCIKKKYLAYDLYKKLQNRTLRVGVLGNLYQENGENFVEADLSSVTQNVAKSLRSLGFEVTVFDMNERNTAIDALMEKPVDFMFNVCERINNNSLLEPHAASLLDILQIPYTGSNPQTLALAIDKIRVKKLLSYHGVPTPNFDYFYSMNDRLEEDLKYPLIVKPANTDNSIGITNDSIVRNRKELKRQLEKVIVEHKRPALVEEYIEGDEVDISILGNDETMQILPLSRSIFDEMPLRGFGIFILLKRNGESIVRIIKYGWNVPQNILPN